jgi:alcohol dehydrogenase (cytochrome c)
MVRIEFMTHLRALALLSMLPAGLSAQVTFDRLLHADKEPQNWLTYSGSYASNRHSSLSQINTGNAKNLELKWIFQVQNTPFETTPLVVNGIMYLTQPPNDVVALDAKTGAIFWVYEYRAKPGRLCCAAVNRGLAILGDTLYMATVDAHLVAIDSKTGRAIWNVQVADPQDGYSMTMAPLVINDKVLVGTAGGEMGIRGRIVAYDAATGKEDWRFYTIPAPGEPGHESWMGDSWQHGGGSVWLTGSYDPELNLTYWGVGNPWPDFDESVRTGDNLYTTSVVALDPDTGKLKWHYQFTPGDHADYDSVQIPVLVNANWRGSPRKLMLWANRNGFYYALDRTTGQFLAGKPFVKENWASGLDDSGRPIRTTKKSDDDVTYPGIQGGTNWYSPSYSQRTGLFYVGAWDNYYSTFTKNSETPLPWRRGAINTWTDDAGHGSIMAIDPATGDKKWEFKMYDVTDSGILTTDGDVLFSGGREGNFYALDARSGAMLWKTQLGGDVASGPITYQIDGKQYVAVGAGHGLFVFGIR